MKVVLKSIALSVLAAATIACTSAAAPAPATGTPSSPGASAPASPDASAPAGGALTVITKDIAFQPTTLTVPANTPTDIVLDNQEAAPHNLAIKDSTGATVFKGEIISQGKVTNAVPALSAGTYQFWCEVHPNMVGTITAA